MTTPTDPYSRGQEPDQHGDDILEPLNSNEDDFSPVFHEDPRHLDEGEQRHDETGASFDENRDEFRGDESDRHEFDHNEVDRNEINHGDQADQVEADRSFDHEDPVTGDHSLDRDEPATHGDSFGNSENHEHVDRVSDEQVVDGRESAGFDGESAHDEPTRVLSGSDYSKHDERPIGDNSHTVAGTASLNGESASGSPADSEPIGDENHTVGGTASLDGESAVESTRSWSPNFDDEVPASSRRDERGFAGFLPGDKTDADAPTEVRPNESVTRTSVFNRPVDEDETVVAPAATSSTPAAAAAPARTYETERRDEPSPFIPDAPGGRGWSHVGVFFATLLLAPFAWYLIEDAGVRLGMLSDSQWATGSMDAMSVLELVGGLACLGVLWFLISFSSVGAQFFGFIIFLAGLVAIVAPGFAKDLLNSSAMQSFGDFNAFTGNVVYHLGNSLGTGRIVVYGFLLLMTGVVSHWARRRGQLRGQVEGERKVLIK